MISASMVWWSWKWAPNLEVMKKDTENKIFIRTLCKSIMLLALECLIPLWPFLAWNMPIATWNQRKFPPRAYSTFPRAIVLGAWIKRKRLNASSLHNMVLITPPSHCLPSFHSSKLERLLGDFVITWGYTSRNHVEVKAQQCVSPFRVHKQNKKMPAGVLCSHC